MWVQIAIIDLAKHCFLFSRLQIKGVSSFFVVTLPETMALHGQAKKYKNQLGSFSPNSQFSRFCQ